MGVIMYYEQDINEIIYAIHCSEIHGILSNLKHCIDQITIPIDDEYLQDRAQFILQELEQRQDLYDAIDQLSLICNEYFEQCDNCPIRKYCNKYIRTCRERSTNDKTMVDLFCGAGGLSLGFTQEGFSVALANDIEECCIETYAHNHPETPRDHIIKGDIRLISEQLELLIAGKSIDVVVGGPPCQGFSMANRQRLIDDPRNYLYRSYVGIVLRTQPRFFVMENVKGMLGVAGQVKEDFEKIGYTVSFHVLNAKDFGVPQNRERLIYIGNRIGVDNEKVFETISSISAKIPQYMLGDALYGLRELKASREKNASQKGSKESGHLIEPQLFQGTNKYIELINQGRRPQLVFNHKARYNNDRDIEIFSRMNPGDRSDDPKIADIMPYSRRNGIFKDKYYKLELDNLCKTITAHMKFDCNMYIHPTQARGLTPREAARVQSYPDDYFFKGPYTKTYMQIGNSVPPLLGRAIAEALKQYL